VPHGCLVELPQLEAVVAVEIGDEALDVDRTVPVDAVEVRDEARLGRDGEIGVAAEHRTQQRRARSDAADDEGDGCDGVGVGHVRSGALSWCASTCARSWPRAVARSG